MGKGFEDSNDHAQPLRPPDRPIRYPEVARMPSNTNDEESNSDEEANIPKTTLHRTEGRVSTTTIPGAVAVDGINRQQRQQSGAYTADDDDDDTLIIQSADDDEIIYQNGAAIPPNLFLQESALQHSVVATLATDDDLSVRVANRVEEKVTKRLKELMDARLSQQQQEEQFCRSQIVAAETVTIEPDNNGEEGKTTSANASGFGWASSSNTTNPFHYDNFKICGVRRRCWGILFSILGLFMLGATIGTYFHFSNQPRPKALTPNTISPTPFPTSLNLWDDLIQLIGDTIVGERGEAAWEDPTTPQYAALSWMARDDLYTIRVLEKESTQNQHNLLVERYALTVLYFASNGPSSWKLSLDFLEPTDVCDWNIGGHSRSGTQQEGAAITTTIMGVYCNNATGSVDSPEIAAMSSVSFLHMAENGMQGALPWELSLLSNLLQINFDGNNLKGTLPIEFSNLSNLQDLWFRSNALTGSLPSQLSMLTNLVSLDLEDNQLTGPLPVDWGKSLVHLFYLSLKLNNLEGTLPVQWADLLTLQFLDLEGNLLDGNIPTQLGKLTELQSLFLERNNFNGPLPTDIARLTNLKQLLVYENQLTGHIPIQWRNGLVKLEVFWFHGNDLTGSVDDIFCLDPGEYPQFVEKDLQGDCSGDPPEIICSCCSKCCAFYGQDCRSQNV